jgi:hypothetical protein
MGQRHSLFAFIAVIAAIVVLALIAASKGQLDSQVFGNAIVGLVGIAGSFRPRTAAMETTP